MSGFTIHEKDVKGLARYISHIIPYNTRDYTEDQVAEMIEKGFTELQNAVYAFDKKTASPEVRKFIDSQKKEFEFWSGVTREYQQDFQALCNVQKRELRLEITDLSGQLKICIQKLKDANVTLMYPDYTESLQVETLTTLQAQLLDKETQLTKVLQENQVLKTSNDVCKSQVQVLTHQLNTLNTRERISINAPELLAAQAAIDQYKKDIESHAAVVANVRKSYDEKVQKLEAKNKHLTKLLERGGKENVIKYKNEVERLKDKLNATLDMNKESQSILEASESDLQYYKEQLENSNFIIQSLKNKSTNETIKKLTESLRNTELQLRNVTEERNECMDKLKTEAMDATSTPIKKKRENLSEKNKRLDEELQKCREDLNKVKTESHLWEQHAQAIDEKYQQLSKYTSDADKNQELNNLKQQNNVLNTEVLRLTDLKTALESINAKHEATIKSLETKNENCLRELAELTRDRESFHEQFLEYDKELKQIREKQSDSDDIDLKNDYTGSILSVLDPIINETLLTSFANDEHVVKYLDGILFIVTFLSTFKTPDALPLITKDEINTFLRNINEIQDMSFVSVEDTVQSLVDKNDLSLVIGHSNLTKILLDILNGLYIQEENATRNMTITTLYANFINQLLVFMHNQKDVFKAAFDSVINENLKYQNQEAQLCLQNQQRLRAVYDEITKETEGRKITLNETKEKLVQIFSIIKPETNENFSNMLTKLFDDYTEYMKYVHTILKFIIDKFNLNVHIKNENNESFLEDMLKESTDTRSLQRQFELYNIILSEINKHADKIPHFTNTLEKVNAAMEKHKQEPELEYVVKMVDLFSDIFFHPQSDLDAKLKQLDYLVDLARCESHSITDSEFDSEDEDITMSTPLPQAEPVVAAEKSVRKRQVSETDTEIEEETKKKKVMNKP